jgi:hypothetical protein
MRETATNQQTGAKIYRDDQGAWQPLESATNPQTGQTAYKIGGKWEVQDRRDTPQQEPQDDRNIFQQGADYVGGLTNEALNTATFGMSDRVKDFAGDLGTQAGNYIGGLINPDSQQAYLPQRANDQRAEFRESNPYSSFAASMVGGMANPVAGKVGQWMSAGKTLPQQMVRGSVGGAGLGAAQAGGETEGTMAERLQAGLNAGAFGGVVGPLIPAGVKAGSALWTGAKNQLARMSPEMQLTSASRKLAQALKDDGFKTTDLALKRMKELGPDATLGDLGDNTRSLVHGVYARGGEGSQKVAQFYSKRQGGTPNPTTGLQEGHAAGRVEGMIDDLGFGKYHDRTALDKLQKEASDLYDKAYAANKVIDTPEINEIMNRQPMQAVMDQSRVGMNITGQNLSMVNKELTAAGREQGIVTGKGIGEGLKLKFLDKVKKRLWSLAETAKRAGDTDLAGDYNQVRKDLTKALDEADTTGFYAQARQKSGGKLAAADARERGKNFISKSEFSDEVAMADDLAEMSADELQNFRMGIAQALKGRVGAKQYKAGNATDAVKGNDALERRIRVAFGDDASFVKFKNQLLAEDELHKTYTKLAGSQTNKNKGSSEYGDSDPNDILAGLQSMALNSPVRGAMQVGVGLKKKFLMPEDTSGELAKLLTSRDLTPIQKQYKAEIMSTLKKNGLAQKLLQGSAGAIGSLNAGGK